MRNLSKSLLLVAAMSATAITGCDKGGDGATGAATTGQTATGAAVQAPAFMELISADTPYVFASSQAMPAATMDKFFGAFEPFFKKGEEELAKVLAKPASEDPQEKIGRALAEELKGNLNKAGFAKFGISTTPRFAIYGVGVLPVIRLELADAKALKALIGRVETKSGQKAPTAKLGEQEYWKISDDGMTGAIAIIGNELVMTFGPDAAQAKLLPAAFGQTKPAKSLASAGTLNAVNKKYGFMGYGTGVVDLNLIAAIVMGDATGLNKEMWTAIGAPTPPLDATCKTEIKGMVAKAPRMVFGYTKLDAKELTAKYVFELDGALAGDLSGLAAPVPGLGGSAPGALMSFGLGLDVAKTVAFAKKTVTAMKAAPYKCAMLGDLNQGVNQAQMAMGQPIPPFVNDIQGMYVEVRDGKFTGGNPTGVKGHLVIAAKNADGLLKMAQGMVPPLASLKVAADGKAVALPAGLLPPVVDAPHIAMTKNAIAISVGAGEEKTLGSKLSAKGGTPAPLFAFAYDVGRFMAMVQDQPGMGADEKAILGALGGIMGHTGYSVSFTKNGLEVTQTAILK
jgi:hypothetical protein